MNPRERWHQKAKEEKPDRRNDTPKDDPIDKSRRKFLRGAFGAGAILALGGLAVTPKQPAIESSLVKELTFDKAVARRRPYAMGRLTGKKFGGQFNRYFGFGDGVKEVRETEAIDFRYELSKLWIAKADKMQGDEPDEEYAEHHHGVLESIEAVYRDYEVPPQGSGPSLLEYRREIDDTLAGVEEVLSFPAIDKKFRLGRNQSEALKLFSGSIDSDLMLSYAMTELMPSENGRANVEAFEFLLKNAGKGFIERIPALGDRKMSFGPYQFTDYALMNIGGKYGKTVIRGASLIDSTIHPPILPPNVESLRGTEHHKAAHLLAVYNLVLLVKNLGEAGCTDVLRNPSFADTAARDYIIAAHHRPAEALRAFGLLLQSRKHAARGTPRTLADFCAADVGRYVRKTHVNGGALRTLFASGPKARSL